MRMKQTGTMILGISVVSILAIATAAATAGKTATQWTVPEPEQNETEFSSLDSPAITVKLLEHSATSLRAYALVLAQGGTGTNAFFTGDYSALSGLRFKIVSDGKALGTLQLFLRGTNNIVWVSKQLAAPTTNNVAIINYCSLDRVTGGWQGLVGTEAEMNAAWAAALADVESIGLRIFQKRNSVAQMLAIADFRLETDGHLTEPASLSRMESILWNQYEVLAMASVSGDADNDGDGLTDLEEAIAGTNPGLASSVFDLRILSTAAEGTLLEWPCVDGGRYDVMTRTDLTQTPVVIATGLLPSAADLTAGKMRFLVTEDDGIKFFAVGVQ